MKRNFVSPVAFGLVTIALVALPLVQSGGDLDGTGRFLIQFGIFVLIFAVITLGLNVQLGYAGISNFGVAGFYLVGAYMAGIFVVAPASSSYVTYVGGFVNALNLFPGLRSEQWLPFIAGAIVAAAACGAMAAVLALLTPRLRADYLAIATIGLAELLRAVTNVQTGLVNGDRGLLGINAPLADLIPAASYPMFYLILVAVVLIVLYLAAERSLRSPYGRVLRAAREDETATAAAGKNIFAFKLQSFVLGAAIMGIGGALYAWFSRGLTPSAFEPFQGTFIFWMMLIVGGIGSNLGALGGAYIVWGVWVITLELTAFNLPDVIDSRIPYFRLIFLGVFFIVMLVLRPQGLISEEQRVSRWLRRVRAPGLDDEVPHESSAPTSGTPS
jgi:branched-chain amino acid transport system permease protein